MRRHTWGIAAALAGAAVLGIGSSGPPLAAQAPSSVAHRVNIAATTAGEMAQWSAQVDSRLADGSLRPVARYADPVSTGRIVESFVQRHRGVEIYGGDVTRITDGGRVTSVSGSMFTGIDVDTNPALDAANARRTIEQLAGAPVVGDVQLMIMPALDGGLALVYRGTARNANTYFIDADSGAGVMQFSEVVYQSEVGAGIGALGDRKKVSASRRNGTFVTWDLLRPAPIMTLDSRGVAQDFNRLADGGPILESDLATDADNMWTAGAVVDTHANLGFVYDYFFKRHNYQGVDGRNSAIVGVVGNSTLLRNNAFYTSPPFGPGGNGGFFFGAASDEAPVTALDIVGHEVMHGVMFESLRRRTGTGLGNVLYLDEGPGGCGAPFWCNGDRFMLVSNEPGALNEGFADVFGTAVEFFTQLAGNGPLRADYHNGEDVGELFDRPLDDPATVLALPGAPYPDHYSMRIQWPIVMVSNGPFLCGTSPCDLFPAAFVNGRVVNQRPYIAGQGLLLTDTGSVHLNPTVLSHAFYLAIEGGRNRTSGRVVQGVGAANREQVERVFFVAVRDLLPRGASFEDTAAALREAARVTYGPSANVTRAVNDALLAVGL